MTPPNKTPGLYLCRISGLQYLDYMIIYYDGRFWLQYFKYRTASSGYQKKVEGWCGLDEDIEIEEIVQLIKADEL